MVLKLYGAHLSTCARRVMIILHEKNVPYEFVPVDMATGKHKEPAYLEKQPFGQVPYIDDDGFVLYESRAIGWYIATKYADQGPALIPSDVKGQARLLQAWSSDEGNFHFANKAIFEVLFKRFTGGQTDPAILKQHLDSLEKTLDVYEKILGKQKYLAGDELTIADLFHIPPMHWLPRTGRDVLSQRPNLKRWWEEISTRASWEETKKLTAQAELSLGA